jgi:hypothetical protein
MPSITLADIKRSADKKYGPLVIEDVPGGPVELVNPLRLSKVKRDKLSKIDEVEGDVEKKLTDIITLAVVKPADAKRLLAEVGDDLTVLADICQKWTGSAQVGEASPSPS